MTVPQTAYSTHVVPFACHLLPGALQSNQIIESNQSLFIKYITYNYAYKNDVNILLQYYIHRNIDIKTSNAFQFIYSLLLNHNYSREFKVQWQYFRVRTPLLGDMEYPLVSEGFFPKKKLVKFHEFLKGIFTDFVIPNV